MTENTNPPLKIGLRLIYAPFSNTVPYTLFLGDRVVPKFRSFEIMKRLIEENVKQSVSPKA